jgi:hypothetical protein
VLSRRTFLQAAAAGALGRPLASVINAAAPDGEVLYNGIRLGSPWPPRLKYPDEHPVVPPYLADPPSVIHIDVGRQLFVDDFLIEETNLRRVWHRATYYGSNPVLRPERPWEIDSEIARRTQTPPNPSAMVFSDGVFFDPEDRLFKMWYMAGYGMATCLATSTDGLTWHRPALDVLVGTNIVNRQYRDSSTVWLDQFEKSPSRRFKMSLFYDDALLLYTSSDGVHWNKEGQTPFAYDRSTFFHNPFRQVWGFSLRANQFPERSNGRYRRYWETPTFGAAANWNGAPPVAWVKADSRDFSMAGPGIPPELYNLDCVAYESVMLGVFSIWRGEPPEREKINEITLGFSRDGFHWHRPNRESFIAVSDVKGSWNWANVQSAGGGCLIAGDRLYFYVSGRAGVAGTSQPGVCSTGVAMLRRDGFASMEWGTASPGPVKQLPGWQDGMLTTRPLRFSGGHLFVNADVNGGELRVEVLDRSGGVLAPFTRDTCEPLRADGTRQPIAWRSGKLADLAGQVVRFRFTMTKGSLYAFWVSDGSRGHSNGYPAAGGPEFSGPVDRAQS